MGFLTGRATFQRFRADGLKAAFGDDHLDKLRGHESGSQKVAAADGVEAGWTAGRHVRDTAFGLEKQVVAEALLFDLCVTTDKLPTSRMTEFYEVELAALSKENPSGLPSARQKREAKEVARERLEQEAKDGRYKRHKCVPVMWDGTTGEVLFGSLSTADADRFALLFEATFGPKLEAVTAGTAGQASTDHAAPAGFAPGSGDGLAWIADDRSRDFLGNDFLLWLWFTADADTDTVALPDGSEVTFMLARSLVLECPRGETGRETIASEGPARLPEARRAVEAGKLPRRAGLTVVRHGEQYELTLHAETLAVGAAKLPAGEFDGARAKLEGRVAGVRHLVETLDGLYGAFLAVRLGAGWPATLARMQRWVARSEARHAA